MSEIPDNANVDSVTDGLAGKIIGYLGSILPSLFQAADQMPVQHAAAKQRVHYPLNTARLAILVGVLLGAIVYESPVVASEPNILEEYPGFSLLAPGYPINLVFESLDAATEPLFADYCQSIGGTLTDPKNCMGSSPALNHSLINETNSTPGVSTTWDMNIYRDGNFFFKMGVVFLNPTGCPSGYAEIYPEVFVPNVGYLNECEPEALSNIPNPTPKDIEPIVAKNSATGDACAGNPINCATGTKIETEVDIILPGEFGLRFVRTYNSYQANRFNNVTDQYDATAHPSEARTPFKLGRGWNAIYGQYLDIRTVGTNSYITARRPNGRQIQFFDNGSSISKAEDVLETLVAVSVGNVAWELTDENDVTEQYDVDGRLLKLINRRGFGQTLNYSSDELQSVTGHFGRQLIFSYFPSGRLKKITDPNGEEYVYSYTGESLDSVTYPGSPAGIRRYEYNDSNFPYALTDLFSEESTTVPFASWTYDASGRAETSEHAVGIDKVTIDYGYAPDTVRVTDAFGKTLDKTFESNYGVLKATNVVRSCTGCTPITRTASYDANGFPSGSFDYKGNETSTTFNNRGLITQLIEGVGTPEQRTTDTIWHPTLRVPTNIKLKDNTGSPVQEVQFVYVNGSLTTRTEIDHTSFNQSNRVTTFAYYGPGDPDGNEGQLKSIDGPRTNVADVTTFKYAITSSADRGVGDLIEIRDAKQNRIEFQKYDASGRLTWYRDANDMRGYRTYDSRGRLTESKVHNFDTDFKYDLAGNLERITLPDGSYIDTKYDEAHRPYEIVDNLGNKIVYTLDDMSNRTAENVYDPTGNLKRTLSRVYDDLSRIESIFDGVSNETIWGYDNNDNLATITNPKLDVTTNGFDPLNRLKQMTNVLNDISTISYNVLDSVTSVTDFRGNATDYIYNGFGDLKVIESPDAGAWEFSYDNAGNRISEKDGRMITTYYDYDELNRLTLVDYSTDVDTQLAYDGSGWTLTQKGRLRQMTDESGVANFRYEARGNPKEVNSTIEGTSYSVWYDYDLAGRIRAIVYPSGRRVDYGIDAIGNVTSVHMTFAGEVTELLREASYRPFGPLENTTRNFVETIPGVTFSMQGTANSFTPNGDIFAVTVNSLSVNSGWPSLQQYMQTNFFDANRNIETMFLNFRSVLRVDTFEYDAANRLESRTRAQGYPSFTFDYDANGNRLQKTVELSSSTTDVTNLTYEAGSNRLTLPMDYDGNGNELANLTREYGDNNRLRRIKDSLGIEIANYRYNGFGRRVAKSLGSQTIIYHYDSVGRLIAETNEFGDSIAEYIYLNNEPFVLVTDADSGIASMPSFVTDQGGLGKVWRRWNNPDASGNQVLISPPENSSNLSTGSQAIYSTTVTNPGTYTLYIRGVGSDWAGALAHFTDALSGATDYVSFNHASWALRWYKRGLPITVSANDVGTAFDIIMTRRTRDTQIDGFVLSLDPNLSQTELDDIIGLNGTPSVPADTYVWEAEGTDSWTAAEGDIYYYYNDHLGTPHFMLDQQGNEVWRAEYDPFGQANVTVQSVTNNLRFPGQYFDAESGLHYNMFRDYDPNTGRYVQSDPIGLAGGLNTYGYAHQNPVSFLDPSGLDAIYINYDYYPVTTPFGKLPLGHGAVVAVDPATGTTKYYEFGRYGDPDGVVRGAPDLKIPDVEIGRDGLPTPVSLDHLYDYLSRNFGHGVSVSATYYPDSDYQGTIDFAEQFRRDHPDYNLLINNCKTFGRAAATACQEKSVCQ